MDGIYGRVGDAVKVRGIFIAPSQLNRIKEAFGHVRFQLLISRTSHKDILTVRLEPREPSVDAASLAEKFSKLFRDECVLTIDRLEFLNTGTIKEDEGLVLDQRQWK
jgi:phenylacetate-CoA ligase